MGEIAHVNGVDIWWEDFGEKSHPTVLLIMGANSSSAAWGHEFINELVANDLHVVIFDNRDVGKSTWINDVTIFATGDPSNSSLVTIPSLLESILSKYFDATSCGV